MKKDETIKVIRKSRNFGLVNPGERGRATWKI